MHCLKESSRTSLHFSGLCPVAVGTVGSQALSPPRSGRRLPLHLLHKSDNYISVGNNNRVMSAWTWILLLLPLVGTVLGGSCGEARLCCKGRDSSCVVQKAPINAIIEDLDDRPCYCDHACLQLGDCCPDLKEACKVVDCEVSEWSRWSECNIDCGPGVMKRSRQIVRPNHNGGKHCPALVQRRGCLGTDCPHNPRSALKETAMLLPASLAFSRRSNESADITKNLRLRYPKDQLEEQRQDRVHGKWLNDKYFVALNGGQRIKAPPHLRLETPTDWGCVNVGNCMDTIPGEVKCVRCELQAMRKLLGYRCKGHGTMERATRWTALSAHQCHGQWVRLEHHNHNDDSCSSCPNRGDFIFI